jgi:hypothetical protein
VTDVFHKSYIFYKTQKRWHAALRQYIDRCHTACWQSSSACNIGPRLALIIKTRQARRKPARDNAYLILSVIAEYSSKPGDAFFLFQE